MQGLYIPVDERLKSINEIGTPSFRFGATVDDLAQYANGLVNWHWQDTAEISYVRRGMLRVRVLEEERIVRAGEGFLIMPGRLHAVLPVHGQPGEYCTVLFDPQLVGGAHAGLIAHRYVQPLVWAEDARFIPLRPSAGWMRDILGEAEDIVAAHEAKAFGYELAVMASLTRIWYALVTGALHGVVEKAASADGVYQDRMAGMIAFIHAHYQEPIRLEDIARAIDVSRGECCRFARRMLQMTPFEYVTQYRIAQSLPLLEREAWSITDIAGRVGFRAVNYYTTTFRQIMGMTPGAYRRRHRDAQK